jgi:predicted enzyme related to lactoylglutathione lyase
MIKDLAFVAYSVADVPRSVAFYRDVVGLATTDVSSDVWAEFAAGPATFGVGRGEALGITPGTQFSVIFEVEDLLAMRERLARQGVDVTDVHETPVCRVFFATDPDGNRFGLHQRKGP